MTYIIVLKFKKVMEIDGDTVESSEYTIIENNKITISDKIHTARQYGIPL